MTAQHPPKLFILLWKFIRWYFRRRRLTSNNKWHIEGRMYADGEYFVPACMPWAAWKVTGIVKNHTKPKNGDICKTCKSLSMRIY